MFWKWKGGNSLTLKCVSFCVFSFFPYPMEKCFSDYIYSMREIFCSGESEILIRRWCTASALLPAVSRPTERSTHHVISTELYLVALLRKLACRSSCRFNFRFKPSLSSRICLNLTSMKAISRSSLSSRSTASLPFPAVAAVSTTLSSFVRGEVTDFVGRCFSIRTPENNRLDSWKR